MLEDGRSYLTIRQSHELTNRLVLEVSLAVRAELILAMDNTITIRGETRMGSRRVVLRGIYAYTR